MRRFAESPACWVAFVALAFAVACGASEGEPCKERDDCQSGLLCCPPGTGRGVCMPACRATTTDAGVDASTSDGGSPDAQVSDGATDGSAPDGSMDGEVSDSAVVDASAGDGAADGQ